MVQLDLSFSSCRIHLEGEAKELDGVPLGIVGRLYVTQHSQPAVRHAFASFEPRQVVSPRLVPHVISPCQSD